MAGNAISHYDRRLLETIARMTAREGGKVPTLTEIAVELGYLPSARATIHRRLLALCPHYVTWAASKRSLRLTAAASALLETPMPAQHDEPISDDILRLLASGLTGLASEQDEGRPPRVPFSATWQRAMNRLVCACIERGVEQIPLDSAAVARLCQQPLGTWPVRSSLATHFPQYTLLIDDEPTPFCRELAIAQGDVEQELQERMMLPVMDLCRMRRTPDAYVAFRAYLIEHPVVEVQELLTASLDPMLGDAGQQLAALYESVPATIQDMHGHVRLCSICGWTLARTPRGTWACGDMRCRDLSDGFKHMSATPYTPHLQRVRRAIRRYIVAPGRYEVDTAATLRALRQRNPLQVDLWPAFDEYDLRITFPNGDVWAVDIKDWRFPELLARTLTPLSSADDLAWDVAFYAIPDARLRERPEYLTILASATPGRSFELCTLSELVRRARTHLAGMTQRHQPPAMYETG